MCVCVQRTKNIENTNDLHTYLDFEFGRSLVGGFFSLFVVVWDDGDFQLLYVCMYPPLVNQRGDEAPPPVFIYNGD